MVMEWQYDGLTYILICVEKIYIFFNIFFLSKMANLITYLRNRFFIRFRRFNYTRLNFSVLFNSRFNRICICICKFIFQLYFGRRHSIFLISTWAMICNRRFWCGWNTSTRHFAISFFLTTMFDTLHVAVINILLIERFT